MDLSKLTYFPLLLLIVITIPSKAQQQVMMQGKEETIYPIDPMNINSVTDFLPLKSILQDKEVIGMGEATHGTKEFFELKSKMFKYLVQEHNVKVFGIEATYAGCLYLNDYVVEGIGNLDSLMKRLEYWTWQTEEVKQLVEWMRIYNQDKPADDKLSFYGFDMQSFSAPLNYLYDYIKLHHSEDAPALMKIITPVYNRQNEIYKTYFSQDKNLIIDTLERVYSNVDKWFIQKESVYLQSHNKKYQQIKLCLQNFKESITNLKGNKNGPSFRDSCMAGMVEQIKALEKGKVFLWAHNGHINKNKTKQHAAYSTQPMGAFLKSKLGDKFYTIGFLFHQGTFVALKTQTSLASKMFSKYILGRKFIRTFPMVHAVTDSPKGSIGSTFSSFGQPAFFIDLTNSSNTVFTTPQLTYSVGAFFMNRNRSISKLIPAQHYDALLFVNNTKPTQLLSYNQN